MKGVLTFWSGRGGRQGSEIYCRMFDIQYNRLERLYLWFSSCEPGSTHCLCRESSPSGGLLEEWGE